MKASFLENKDAVSSVVTAILLLSVITTFIAAINSYYIPSLVADHEIHHMQDVRNSFMEIAASASPGSSKERVLVPLGDGGLPFLSSLSSSGTLTVSPDKGKIEVTMTNAPIITELDVDIDEDSESPITDIYSLSNLNLKVSDDAVPGTYTASIDGDDDNKISVYISSSTATVTTTIDGVSINYEVTSLPSSYSLNLLDSAYGFDDVINSQLSDFSLYFTGMSETNYFIVAYPTPVTTTVTSSPISSDGQFCYKSSNNQWIDQNYIFEGGAVILNQGEDSIIRSQPFFNIDSTKMDLCLFDITSTDASVSSNGATVVNVIGTEGDENDYYSIYETTIKVTTSYPKAWYNYLNRQIDPNLGDSVDLSGDTVTAHFYNRDVSITTSDVDIVLPK